MIKKKCIIVGAAEKKKTKDKKKMDMDFIWHYSSQHNIVSAGDRLLQKSGQSGIKRIFSGINK